MFATQPLSISTTCTNSYLTMKPINILIFYLFICNVIINNNEKIIIFIQAMKETNQTFDIVNIYIITL